MEKLVLNNINWQCGLKGGSNHWCWSSISYGLKILRKMENENFISFLTRLKRLLHKSLTVVGAKTQDAVARTDCEDAVINSQTTVNLSSSAFSDLGHEDT